MTGVYAYNRGVTKPPLPTPVLFGLDRAAFDALSRLRLEQRHEEVGGRVSDGSPSSVYRHAGQVVAEELAWRTEFADQVDRHTSGTDPLGSPIEAPYAAMCVVHHTGGVEVVARSYWLARDPWWLSTIGEIERVDDGLEIVTYLLTGHAA